MGNGSTFFFNADYDRGDKFSDCFFDMVIMFQVLFKVVT